MKQSLNSELKLHLLNFTFNYFVSMCDVPIYKSTEDVLRVYLEQIEDLHTEFIVKIAIARAGHVVDEYESVSLSL